MIEMPKSHRRGDLALVIGVICGLVEGYRTISPANAAQDDTRIIRLEQAFQDFRVDVTGRLAVLESKAKR